MALKIAEDIASGMKNNGKTMIDPALIAVIIEVISQVVVYIINKCKPTPASANHPSIIQRFRLRFLVHSMGRKQGLGFVHREEVFQAILKKGETVTQDDINNALAPAGTN